MHLRKAAAAIIVALALGAGIIGAGAVSAKPDTLVKCGAEITTSVTLGNGLTDCTHGLVVKADNITIDLGGHILEGSGLNDGIGIDAEGHDNITLRDGTVRGFVIGIDMTGSEDSFVRDLDSLQSVGTGVVMEQAERSQVLDSRVEGNGGFGISIDAGVDNKIKRNRISANAKPGVYISNGSSGNVVAGNAVIGNDTGLNVANSSDTILQRNKISGTQNAGIHVFSSENTDILFNDVRMSSGAGINLITSTNTEVKRNKVGRNGLDGIYSEEGKFEVFARNISNGNNEDGIQTLGLFAVTVHKNVARNNGFGTGEDDDLGAGISIGSLLASGSGNKVSGNDNPVQCNPDFLCS